MPAISIIGSAYDNLKQSRRQKEAEARVRITREMEALHDEFAALVYRAKAEGATVSAIAREMGTSRTLVYQILEQGGIVADAVPLIADPRIENVRYDAASGLYTITDPHGTSYQYDSDVHPVPYVVPADMDSAWWAWWDEHPTGRATIHPYIKEQEEGR